MQCAYTPDRMHVHAPASSSGCLVCHRDDDIALFVSGFDIPVRLDHVLQRIATINQWFQPARLTQRCENNECFSTRHSSPADDGRICCHHLPQSFHRCPHHGRMQIRAVRLQRAVAVCERRRADRVETTIVGLAVSRLMRSLRRHGVACSGPVPCGSRSALRRPSRRRTTRCGAPSAGRPADLPSGQLGNTSCCRAG